MVHYTIRVEQNLGQKSLLTAIIPMKASLEDLDNVRNWFSQKGAGLVHFVLVCDRATNEIRAITESLPTEYPSLQIEVVNGEYFGPGPARNAGIRLISSRYVAFWDSDDLPNILEIVSTLKHVDPDSEIFYVGSFAIRSPGGSTKTIKTFNLTQLARNPGLWRCLIPANTLGGSVFPNYLLGEDQVFLANIVAKIKNIEYCEDVFYSYTYGNSGQLTSTKDYSPLRFSESIIRAIDVSNFSSEVSNFIYNLSTKQVLTMIRHGNLKIRLISSFKLIKRITIERKRCLKSIIDMARVPISEQLNV
jgi:glycosyltransferase involved in cell wall biosynthesis